jgi:hypothetical protein
MTLNKSPIRLAGYSLASFSLIMLLGGLSAQAQMPSEAMIESQIIAQVTFEPPGNRTLDRSQGGATRDSGYCPTDSLSSTQSVVPLMPQNSRQEFAVSDRPTFFMYVPSTSAQQIFFTLKDQTEDYYYQKMLSVPKGASIISIELPEDAPALEVGKNYRWTFALACQVPVGPDSPMVTGWVKRVSPSEVGLTQLDPTPSLETAKSYASAGVWFDALTTLARLRQQQPENYTATWEQFLTSAGLEAIATKPLMLEEN